MILPANRSDFGGSCARNFDLLWRTFARRHPCQREIRRLHHGFHPHHGQAATIDSRKHQFDHRHRHHGGEPHHSTPRRRQPQSDGGDEFDHREINRGGSPPHTLIFPPPLPPLPQSTTPPPHLES